MIKLIKENELYDYDDDVEERVSGKIEYNVYNPRLMGLHHYDYNNDLDDGDWNTEKFYDATWEEVQGSVYDILADPNVSNVHIYLDDGREFDVAQNGDILENYITEAFDSSDTLEDLIQEFEQEYDSSVTSINSAKLPTIFGLVQKLGGFKQGTLNLDYGGGRWDNVAQYLKDYDVLNLVYDPFNRSKEHNKDVIDFVRNNGGADTVTCSNVLNVIKEPENRLSVIKNCDRLVKPGGTVYFTVYEGSGSGEGKANDKRKSYQTNMRTEDYQGELEQVFSSVTRKGKLFICK